MSESAYDAEWRDPSKWRAGWLRLYVAPRDPRILVPMHPRSFGWTLILGQRRTWILMLLIAVLMISIVVLIATRIGTPTGRG